MIKLKGKERIMKEPNPTRKIPDAAVHELFTLDQLEEGTMILIQSSEGIECCTVKKIKPTNDGRDVRININSSHLSSSIHRFFKYNEYARRKSWAEIVWVISWNDEE